MLSFLSGSKSKHHNICLICSDKLSEITSSPDNCKDVFHYKCLRNYVDNRLKNEQSVICPVDGCMKIFSRISNKFKNSTKILYQSVLLSIDENQCCICFSKYNIPVATSDSCTHTFCYDCMKKWCTFKHECPMDRMPIKLLLISDYPGGHITSRVEPPAIEQDLNGDGDNDELVNTLCEICHSGENEHQLLLCDHCDKGYHTYCLPVALNTIPDGDWFCHDCQAYATIPQDSTVVPGRRMPRRLGGVITTLETRLNITDNPSTNVSNLLVRGRPRPNYQDIQSDNDLDEDSHSAEYIRLGVGAFREEESARRRNNNTMNNNTRRRDNIGRRRNTALLTNELFNNRNRVGQSTRSWQIETGRRGSYSRLVQGSLSSEVDSENETRKKRRKLDNNSGSSSSSSDEFKSDDEEGNDKTTSNDDSTSDDSIIDDNDVGPSFRNIITKSKKRNTKGSNIIIKRDSKIIKRRRIVADYDDSSDEEELKDNDIRIPQQKYRRQHSVDNDFSDKECNEKRARRTSTASSLSTIPYIYQNKKNTSSSIPKKAKELNTKKKSSKKNITTADDMLGLGTSNSLTTQPARKRKIPIKVKPKKIKRKTVKRKTIKSKFFKRKVVKKRNSKLIIRKTLKSIRSSNQYTSNKMSKTIDRVFSPIKLSIAGREMNLPLVNDEENVKTQSLTRLNQNKHVTTSSSFLSDIDNSQNNLRNMTLSTIERLSDGTVIYKPKEAHKVISEVKEIPNTSSDRLVPPATKLIDNKERSECKEVQKTVVNVPRNDHVSACISKLPIENYKISLTHNVDNSSHKLILPTTKVIEIAKSSECKETKMLESTAETAVPRYEDVSMIMDKILIESSKNSTTHNNGLYSKIKDINKVSDLKQTNTFNIFDDRSDKKKLVFAEDTTQASPEKSPKHFYKRNTSIASDAPILQSTAHSTEVSSTSQQSSTLFSTSSSSSSRNVIDSKVELSKHISDALHDFYKKSKITEDEQECIQKRLIEKITKRTDKPPKKSVQDFVRKYMKFYLTKSNKKATVK